MRPVAHRLVWVGVAVVLALVTAAYFNPHLAVELANQVWACF